MDIRNFFAGGAAGGGGDKKKAAGAPSVQTTLISTSKKDTTTNKKPIAAKPSKKLKEENKPKAKAEKPVIEIEEKKESSAEEVKKEKEVKNEPKAKLPRKTLVIDSDTDDDDIVAKSKAKQVKPEKRLAFDSDTTDDDDFVSKPKVKPKQVKPKASKSSPKSNSAKRKVIDLDTDDGDGDGDSAEDDSDEEYTHVEATPVPSKTRQSPRKNKAVPKAAPKAAPKKESPKKRKITPKKEIPIKLPPIKPFTPIKSFPDPLPGIFDGFTFVFTGNMQDLPRDDAIDYVKSYGGRVTTAVSSKTNYLVIGTILEDGRPIEEGSKFKKATEIGDDKVVILNGEGDFYGLAKILDEKKRKETGADMNANTGPSTAKSPAAATSSSIANPYSKKSPTVSNPYSKSSTPIANPYGKKTAVANPYAQSSSSSANPYAAKASSEAEKGSCSGGGRASVSDPNALWADKYAPNHTRMILGNKEAVAKLTRWLQTWEDSFNGPKGKQKSFNIKNGPFKAALLSGPPGIGKTTTAQLVAAEAGRQVLELNASDARSKKMLESSLGDVTGSQVLTFEAPKKKGELKKRCIIMDEVDGMGAGDRSGMAELIKMIKTSMVPIICICNDRQSQKIKSLAGYCLDLRYRRPVKSVIARRTIEVGKAEGMEIEYNAAEAVAESCGNDIRQVLNCLQMWGNKRHATTNKKTDMTYKDYKVRDNLINKDEMLRVTLFDAARMICEGRKGLSDTDAKTQVDSFFRRTDAFFSDYALMGLLVHQNYLKVAVKPFLNTKTKGDAHAEHQSLVDMYKGTEAMSDYAVAEHGVRSGDQNWGLLPFCATLAVKSGYHVGGESGGFLPGFPEFSSWLGKNSSRGRMDRLLQEFGHHMNYKVSADKTELRLGYLPAIRDRFASLMMSPDGDSPQVEEAISLMDEYGLDRDDIFENIDEFVLDKSAKKFADLDSKTKSAFTREYNKSVHKSQALIEEQGGPKRKRKKIAEEGDEDIENADNGDDDGDDDLSPDEIKKMFASSKRGKKKAAPKSKKGKK
jgi:replication factor C subunit 1